MVACVTIIMIATLQQHDKTHFNTPVSPSGPQCLLEFAGGKSYHSGGEAYMIS